MALLETIFFYVFALGVLASSTCVVLFRNPLYGAIALILDLVNEEQGCQCCDKALWR